MQVFCLPSCAQPVTWLLPWWAEPSVFSSLGPTVGGKSSLLSGHQCDTAAYTQCLAQQLFCGDVGRFLGPETRGTKVLKALGGFTLRGRTCISSLSTEGRRLKAEHALRPSYCFIWKREQNVLDVLSPWHTRPPSNVDLRSLHRSAQPSTLSYQHIIKPSQTLPACLFPASCYSPFARQRQPQSAA